MPVSPASAIDDIQVIKTGLFIDRLVGGGVPKMRITEITGEPGMGKSTLCLQVVAEAQKLGQKCLWADVEGSFTPRYARLLGVDMEKLDVLRERTAEDILNKLLEFVDKETYDLIIIDSIGTLTPRAEHEKEVGEAVIGSQARPISQFVKKLAIMLMDRNVAVVAVNHIRTNIMTGGTEARGGASWNYHKAVRIHLKKKFGVVLKQGENTIGYTVVAEVKEKNKMVGNVGTKVESQFINNEGFSKAADLLQDALDAGVITKQGNTHYFGEEKLGMISKVRELMKDEDFNKRVKDAVHPQ